MILNTLKNYPKIRKIPFFIFLSLTFVLFLDFYGNSEIFKGFQSLNNGMQTCFSRVNQSFVSKVFSKNNSSVHLKPEFFSLTEECFGEVLKKGEPLFSRLGLEIDSKINALVSEIYWFHKDLSGKVEIEKIKKRFKTIETLNIAAMKRMESLDNIGIEKAKKNRIWLFVSFFGLFVTLIFDIFISHFLYKPGSGKEEDKEVDKVTTVLNYPITPSVPKPNFINPLAKNSPLNLPGYLKGELIDSPIIESTHLDEVLTKVIDVLSMPLFKNGIKLELEINEDICIFMDEEILSQSLFSFLNFSINNFLETNLDRKIILKTKLLGETAIFEIANNGAPFGEDLLKDASGLALEHEFNKRILDLKIGAELIKENSGNVFFENSQEGARIRIKVRSSKLSSQKIKTKIIANKEIEVNV